MALNKLPEMESDLINMQARIRVSGIAAADEMLEQIDQQMEEADADMLEQLQAKKTEIMEQKIVYAERDVAIRNLLERITAMKMEGRGRKKKDTAGKCDEPEEFYRLTRREYKLGEVVEYSEDDVTRLVEKIVVGETIRVEFKAGVSVEV